MRYIVPSRFNGLLFISVLSASAPDSCSALSPERFKRGDSNADGDLDISDAIYDLNTLYGNGAPWPCAAAADGNDDGAIDLSDPIYKLSFTFLGGKAPPEPFPGCGTDPTAQDPDLSCEAYASCKDDDSCPSEDSCVRVTSDLRDLAFNPFYQGDEQPPILACLPGGILRAVFDFAVDTSEAPRFDLAWQVRARTGEAQFTAGVDRLSDFEYVKVIGFDPGTRQGNAMVEIPLFAGSRQFQPLFAGANLVTVHVGLLGRLSGGLDTQPTNVLHTFQEIPINTLLPELFLVADDSRISLGEEMTVLVGTRGLSRADRRYALSIEFISREGSYEPDSMDGISFPQEVVIPAGDWSAKFQLKFELGMHGSSSSIAALRATSGALVGRTVPISFNALLLTQDGAHHGGHKETWAACDRHTAADTSKDSFVTYGHCESGGLQFYTCPAGSVGRFIPYQCIAWLTDCNIVQTTFSVPEFKVDSSMNRDCIDYTKPQRLPGSLVITYPKGVQKCCTWKHTGKNMEIRVDDCE